ncbi:N-acetylneuraminate synthase family protein [Candidatus Woesearchaeota archaeon]|nr:N-acetylneuraminate synthase family protein [Candidatus Woesearchaeota archaeon]
MAKKSRFKEAMEDENCPYIIGETAYIHEGNFSYMNRLIHSLASKKSCDGVKFHIMIDIDSYFTKDHPAYSIIKKSMFSKSQWIMILEKAKSSGFDNIVLADDLYSIDFVKENVDLVDAVEIHAVALNNIEMLERVKGIKVPIILGIGGSGIKDIEFAVKFLDRKDILLMHGFQNYPTRYEYINFRRMQKIKEKFGLPVGYADHTAWDDKNNELMTLAGFMAGPNIIEKHVALEAGKKRTDYDAAVSAESLREIRGKMGILNKAKGDGSFEISDYENIYARKGPMKFTIVAAGDIKKGSSIGKKDLAFRRTKKENTIEQREFFSLIGKKAKEPIKKYSLISWRNVEK